MTKADGEKELILGNKQLISLFFVVVALCGVFFAMGYMIGRNTSRPATANLDTPPAAVAVPAEQPSPVTPADKPAAESAAATPDAPAVSADEHPPTAAETPAVSAASSTQTQAARDTPAAVPQPGATYLQVTALRRPDADNLVRTLREQNFPALLAESSKADLFRVLVGPYRQTADVADAKAKLKALGFANAFVQK